MRHLLPPLPSPGSKVPLKETVKSRHHVSACLCPLRGRGQWAGVIPGLGGDRTQNLLHARQAFCQLDHILRQYINECFKKKNQASDVQELSRKGCEERISGSRNHREGPRGILNDLGPEIRNWHGIERPTSHLHFFPNYPHHIRKDRENNNIPESPPE